MSYATINDCQLYYEAAGGGPAAIYVHGGFARLDTVLRDPEEQACGWEHDFARACHFIAYDRRGCARSSSPVGGYDLVTQARDLAGLLDHLHIDAAHVIGSPAGGPIALTFAALYPARTRSLILTGTAIDLFPPGEPGSEEVRRQLVVLERDGAAAA
jgi:pimeloyl-ACP methyl ester carboxylesterase